jgi:hypothetical protein
MQALDDLGIRIRDSVLANLGPLQTLINDQSSMLSASNLGWQAIWRIQLEPRALSNYSGLITINPHQRASAMIMFLAKLGRFNSVIVITLVTVSASLAATMVAVTLLNQQGFSLHTEIASS